MQTKLSCRFAFALAFAVAAPAAIAPPAAQAEDVQTVTLSAQASSHMRLGKNISRVSVASSDIADVAAFPPDQLLITGKRPGQTNATIWTQSGEVVVLVVEVTYPLDAMRAGLRKAIPGGSKLDVASAGATVILSGEVPSVEDVARAETIVRGIANGASGGADVSLVNMLTVPGDQQVQLEVSFAEVSRSSLRQIGFNFWSKGVNSAGNGYAGGVLAPTNGLDGISPELTTAPDVRNLNAGAAGFDDMGAPISDTVPLITAPLQGAFGFVFSSTLGGFPFSAALSLLANKGYARTLAEPTLVAMSGKSASFLAGGEFPIPLPQSLGQIAVEYRKFGIQLEFEPTVIGPDIQMNLGVTVSDIDYSLGVRLASTTVPGLTERHSKTTVRLRDGQSFVIAGLLSDQVRSTVDKVPWLGDIPVLGTLFRSSSYRREETELLVVVTAHLVQPLDERPQLPGEHETSDPGDLELFLLGKSESIDEGNKRPQPTKRRKKGKPVGAVGFQR